jgi:DNA polymerase (family X)
MQNGNIAEIFDRMGTLLEIKGENVFKIRAYYAAAENIRNLSEDIDAVRKEGRLNDIPGIGEALRDYLARKLR